MKKKMSSFILFSIIIIIISLLMEQSTIWCVAENKNVTFVGCVPRERKALLRFKASLSDPSNRLSSWNTTNHDDDDCCAWQGVECDKATGHVTGLHLQSRDAEIIYNDYPYSGYNYYQSPNTTLQSKTIDSSSLLELNYLSHLDLSGNDFQGSSIPASLGSLKQLKHLNLSNANFSGIVPQQLGNPSSLHTLDLNCLYQYENYLTVDDLTWASNLSSLEYLDLSHVNLSGTKYLIKVLGMIPSIVVLKMSESRLDSTNLAHTCLLNSTLLAKVQYLDLNFNSFEGEFPCFLHNMTSLRFLDLSDNQYNSSDPSRPFMRLKNLSHLNLGGNPLNPKAADWISDLVWDKCHLKSLNLHYYNYFGGSNYYGDLSGAFKNLSGCWIQSLETLDLRGNAFADGHLFDGHWPEELGELKQLKELYLSGNRFSGPIPPSLGNLTTLKVLDVSRNQLSGKIPISIGQLLNLEVIDISSNEFNGHLPGELGELKHLTLLVVSGNQLSGKISISIGQLSNLEKLVVSDNKFSGPIPSSLGNLTTLRWLNLENNQLSGEVPTTMGQLSNLEFINISHNALEGILSEAHFANLSKLKYLSVEYNMLKFRVGHNWVPPFRLVELGILSTDLGGQFPQWLQTQNRLTQLELSNCRITGMLPKWLNSTSLGALYLSGNHIEGPILELPSNLRVLDLSDNRIYHFPSNMILPLLDHLNLARNFMNGSIPDSLCEMKALQTLDLSGNQLSGILPDCWGNFESLAVVRLSSNRLSGAIPNSIGGASGLRWLHLDNNNFTGQIPYTLKKCTMLMVLDVGDNKLSGKLPAWIGDHLLNLAFLRLRNNEFCGVIPPTYCQPSRLQVMDLANNNLTGNIPLCFRKFKGMVEGGSIIDTNFSVDGRWFYEHLTQVMKGVTLEFTKTTAYVVNLDLSCNHLAGEIPSELTTLTGLIGLNLSHNHLVGKIPQNVGDMKSLESLDLSSNNLSGTIPQSLSKLNFITHLDLSNNDLSGPIPTGPQLQTLDNTSNYGGNPRLCGPPLQKKCHFNETPPKVQNDAEGGDAADKIYLYAFVISGLATGFWGYFGVLVFQRRWRLALFRYMDVAIGKMLGRR